MVSAVGSNGEAAGVICVKCANVLNGYMQFIGRWVEQYIGISWGRRQYGGHIGLGALAHIRV